MLKSSTILEGEVKMPSGERDQPIIQDNRDGTVSIRYEPREEGLHELHVRYNEEHVQGKNTDLNNNRQI